MQRLSAFGAGAALAITLVVSFALCALLQAILPAAAATHKWLSLFTAAPIGTAGAWLGGMASSIVFGFVAGYVFAVAYNMLAARKS